MGRASPLLSPRLAALAALAAVDLAYYSLVGRLWTMSLWPNVAWLSIVVVPAVFGLVFLALPLRRVRGLVLVAAVCAGLAALFQYEGTRIPADFAKLAAMTLLAWVFLTLFEDLGWVVLVACIIPFVDSYSVWKGPTHHIVTKQQGVFSSLSVAFPVPGGGSAAYLGLPDLLFFGLFLAASVRFRLRPGLTWVCMTLSIGATMALAQALGVGGLPALPLLSVGFLLPNADLIWHRLRRR